MGNALFWLTKVRTIVCAGMVWSTLAASGALTAPAIAGGEAGMPPAEAEPAGTVHPQLWRELAPALPKDPALEARISALLSGMTLEQKAAQLIQADIDSLTPEELRHYPLGSILNGGNSGPGDDDLAPASEWPAAADRFYDASVDRSHGPRLIPTLWGTDAVHGDNNVIGATLFPHNIGPGAARDPELFRRIGEATAAEVRVTEIFSRIRQAVTAAGSTVELSSSGEYKSRPDVAVVGFGETPRAHPSDLTFLRRLHARGVPVAAVFLSGRPLWVNPQINASDAFVAAWLHGSEGAGVADVLFKAAAGKAHDFRGRLSFSWPPTPRQTAVDRGETAESPSFPYGYGLTYASPVTVARLPENPGNAEVNPIDARSFFAADRPGAEWPWVAGAGWPTSRAVPGGVGVAGEGRPRLSATDDAAQEDARRLNWAGGAADRVSL